MQGARLQIDTSHPDKDASRKLLRRPLDRACLRSTDSSRVALRPLSHVQV
jgi:hypothetical protein